MKMLKIIGCNDHMLWYADLVGQRVPYLGIDTDPRGPIYWSREPAGYKNLVFCQDAVLVDLDTEAA